ncbi:MAG: potassium/proton antiporter, partial [Victivallaceae bacterium]|nr:potassium/proton antiporter [Victivallaceae bacterium]
MTGEFCVKIAILGAVMLGGALSNKFSSRFNMPVLLAFLGFGLVLNVYIPSANDRAINELGTVAMAFILFSGGLNTRFHAVKKVFVPGAVLATLGVLITGVILGLGAYCYLDWYDPDSGIFDWKWCLLLGAIISSTDAASVFGILRGRGVALEGNLKELLEFESGSNDPMAYFCTRLMMTVVAGSAVVWYAAVGEMFYSMAMGVAFGVLFGLLGRYFFRWKMEYEGLYFVFGVSLVLLTYGCSETCGANGMMACYVAGITMGHLRFNYQRGISRFSDGVSWLMQVALFTTLGFSVDRGALFAPSVLVPGLLLSLVLMFVARPVAVFLCSIGSGRSAGDNLLISWVGLRGAAPIVLATFPLAQNLPGSSMMFNMIFFMVLTSILIQGATLMPVARMLGKARRADDRVRLPLELEVTRASSGSDMYEFTVAPGSPCAGRTLAEIGFPENALVMMIRRGEELLSPRGGSKIEAGDGVLVMAKRETMSRLARTYFPEHEYVAGPDPEAAALPWIK